MNILTDVLSLIRRSVFAKKAELDDVLILGTNEEPDMTGVASPIPYKSIKVIKVRDFKVAAENCNHANSPADPAAGTAQVYQKTESSEVTETCTVFFRSLKSLSSNLTLAISSDDNYVEITTEGEPNTGANVGSGFGLFKDKVGEVLNFRSIVAGSGISIAQSANQITLTAPGGRPYTSYVALLNQNSTNAPTATVLENTTGNNITWTRVNTGIYRGTWDTALADMDKVFFAPALGNLKNQTVVVNVFSASTTQFQVGVQAQGSLADSELIRTGIEIRIYP
jgi:hypothetical protein|tara:strand:- start:232 stop:1074 length:843 start_codon:yes stop_codon:yes gene_type:complete